MTTLRRCLAGTCLALAFASPAAAQQLAHTFSIADQMHEYPTATGTVEFVVPLLVAELPGSLGYPSVATALGMGLSFDPNQLELIEVLQGDVLAALNTMTGPEFWAPTVLNGGFTLGAVFNFMNTQGVTFASPTTAVQLRFRTLSAYFSGNLTGGNTDIAWTDSLSPTPGAPPSVNLVTVRGTGSFPDLEDGTVSLQPSVGSVFDRGDCNGDGAMDIADVIYLINYLFPMPPSSPMPTCLDSCDANDNGVGEIADVLGILFALFGVTTTPVAPPSGFCGPDPTPTDPFDCQHAAACP